MVICISSGFVLDFCQLSFMPVEGEFDQLSLYPNLLQQKSHLFSLFKNLSGIYRIINLIKIPLP